MAPLDSAHKIGVSILSGSVLNVDQGVCRWRFKNREIGDVFNYCGRTRRDTAKRTTALDSARLIGVSTLSKDVPTVDEGVCRWGFKFAEFGTFLIIAEELGQIRRNGGYG